MHIAQKIVFSTDVIVVGIVLGSSASGVYSVPAKLFALAFGIGTAATSLMFPAFAELEGAGATEASAPPAARPACGRARR